MRSVRWCWPVAVVLGVTLLASAVQARPVPARQLAQAAQKTLALREAMAQVKQLNELLDKGEFAKVIEITPAMVIQATERLGEAEEYVLELSNLLAIAHSEYGNYAEALSIKERIVALRVKHHGTTQLNTAMAALNLVSGYVYMDRVDEARALLDQVAKWNPNISNARLRDHFRFHLANVGTMALHTAGDRLGALSWVQKGIKWELPPRDKQDDPLLLALYRSLGVALAEVGAHRQAQAVANLSMARVPKLYGADSAEVAHTHIHLGMTYLQAGDWQLAERQLSDGLQQLKGRVSATNRHSLSAEGMAAQARWMMRPSNEVAEALVRVHELTAKHQGNSIAHRRLTQFLGNVYAELGNWEKAQAFFLEEEERYGGGAQFTLERLQAVLGLARVHRQRQEMAQAEARLEQAAALVRQQATLTATTLGRVAHADFLDSAVAVYALAIDLALDEGQPLKAMRWFEESQQGPAVQALKLRLLSRDGGEASPTAHKEWLDALNRAAMLDVRIARKYESAQRVAWEAERRSLDATIEALGARLRGPGLGPNKAALGEQSLAPVPEGQQALSYFPLDDGRLAVFWWNSQGELRVWRTKPQPHLSTTVAVLRGAIVGRGGPLWVVESQGERFWVQSAGNQLCSERQWHDYLEALGRMKAWPGRLRAPDWPSCRPPGAKEVASQAVVAEISRHLAELLLPAEWRAESASIGRVTVVPTGALWHLPWDVLEVRQQPLVKHAEVSLIPSLAMLRPLSERARALQQNWRSEDPGRLLAVGPSAIGGATPGAKRANAASDSLRQALAKGKASLSLIPSLAKLPYSGQEIDAASSIWGSAHARVLKGTRASEQTLRALSGSGELARFRWLWVAAHGVHDEAWPELSAVLFASTGKAEDSDGILTASEWQALSLDARLVVLSACETALGRPRLSGGSDGLVSSVLLAGAVGTTQSLWRVSDRATAQMMRAYLERLRQGMDPIKALALTKRQMLSSAMSKQQAASTWAAFQHYGQ